MPRTQTRALALSYNFAMTTDKSSELLDRLDSFLDRLEAIIPARDNRINWSECRAATWRRRAPLPGYLHPLSRTTDLAWDDIRCVDRQKAQLEANTRQFLAGLPANNALLWGPRGTGKSSLIKGLLNEFGDAGLRLVELSKTDLGALPEVLDEIHEAPARFIVFCDDLSFNLQDDSYKSLKGVLEGSLAGMPNNVLVYATSNRRHLLPEQLSDNLVAHNDGGEIHHSEAVEEKISLSERFGLWLAFYPFNQQRYLDIVHHWLTKLGTPNVETEAIRSAALQWALTHGSRSGRSAWQFAKDWTGKHGLHEQL